ncbi:MAG: hypothetical protein P8Y76_12785 [bacterium]|jgi:hypothetical protein
MRSRPLLACFACATALVAACAPDAMDSSPAYDAFLTRLQQACVGQKIGSARVDDLIEDSQTSRGGFFVDQTSRLYFGTTSPQDYATGVSAFLNGWPSDPGVQCVLREYEQQRQFTTPAPSAAPPQR